MIKECGRFINKEYRELIFSRGVDGLVFGSRSSGSIDFYLLDLVMEFIVSVKKLLYCIFSWSKSYNDIKLVVLFKYCFLLYGFLV